MNTFKIGIYTAFLFVICLMACQDGDTEIVQTLSEERKSLVCEMERLRLKTDSLWDAMGLYLDQNLPTDLPTAERKNMATTRSAHLISLFKAFPTLDAAIQTKVNEAGMEDKHIADQMKVAMDKFHEVERDLNEALQKIENRSKQQYQKLKKELQALEELPCRS